MAHMHMFNPECCASPPACVWPLSSCLPHEAMPHAGACIVVLCPLAFEQVAQASQQLAASFAKLAGLDAQLCAAKSKAADAQARPGWLTMVLLLLLLLNDGSVACCSIVLC